MSWNLARNLGYDKSKSQSIQQYNVYLFMHFIAAPFDDRKKKNVLSSVLNFEQEKFHLSHLK